MLQVILDFDTLKFNYQSPTLKFYRSCISTCKLSIIGEDNSRNSLPNVYWVIENVPGYRFITGPFSNEGY